MDYINDIKTQAILSSELVLFKVALLLLILVTVQATLLLVVLLLILGQTSPVSLHLLHYKFRVHTWVVSFNYSAGFLTIENKWGEGSLWSLHDRLLVIHLLQVQLHLFMIMV